LTLKSEIAQPPYQNL